MPEVRFDGRPVLVFGASGALGAGVAAALAEAGASVIGVDRAKPPAERALDGVAYREADAGDEDAVRALFDSMPAPWAVLNTVGGYAAQRSLADLDLAELAGQVSLNLVTAAVITKHALRVMQPVGRGRIVHTASRSGVVTAGSGFAYSVSKAGVLHLVSMAADEVRGSGITVNCVVPSFIDTPANRAAIPNADYSAWPKVPDIAQTFVYLASPGSGLVNGAAIPV
ncbi:MAG TPA: SDR family oxidoreductase [Streptosporangiaceae bacterium]|nr:SDR family oxidoreductase [Streptosporangiaceae bacterium]